MTDWLQVDWSVIDASGDRVGRLSKAPQCEHPTVQCNEVVDAFYTTKS